MAGILSMLAFFMTAFPVVDITQVPFGEILNYLGGQGLFVAIILGILTTEGMRWFRKKGIAIKLPDSVPPYVLRTFNSLSIHGYSPDRLGAGLDCLGEFWRHHTAIRIRSVQSVSICFQFLLVCIRNDHLNVIALVDGDSWHERRFLCCLSFLDDATGQ